MKSVWHTQLSKVKRLVKVGMGADLFMREQIVIRKERHGSDYGGWWIHPDRLKPTSTVYSFGVGTDISFDISLIRALGVRVYAFDPTPRSIAWIERQQLPSRFRFHPIGLADFDGEQEFQPPAHEDHVSYSIVGAREGRAAVRGSVRTLASIMSMLEHDRIDLLKMDIEGAEYPVLRDILSSGIAVEQILVEFHHGHHGLTANQTREAVAGLNQAGYRIFSVSPNGPEYSFLYVPA